MNFRIRDATEHDLNQINDIYNHYVLNTTSTAQEIPDDWNERKKWFDRLTNDGLPVIVAENEDRVVGWGSLTRFNERSAYRYCAENSVYVDHNCLGHNIGSILMADLLERAKRREFTTIVAKINGQQSASIRFHEKFGFKVVGNLKKVNFKFNRFSDVCLMQKDLA